PSPTPFRSRNAQMVRARGKLRPRAAGGGRMAGRIGSILIENVQPQIDCGRHPVKRVVGEPVRVTADVFKEGHDELTAVLRWRQLTPSQAEPREVAMRPLGNDAWEGQF